ncbi:flagellar basal body-associated FliL family protein [Psychroserpens luteolus]|uniref:flagellar basal body-associated FliL family protein n=1 Tax=Psychroserpens luteolus TaxID=2855840 RepID=UPI001E487D81|nr:flagellar basal body-associated FliL family protein [Psychroserpens luteolus]MCD2258134.1 flagellar basal body-associated FliL family protein [Psychroserpens luteolus]
MKKITLLLTLLILLNCKSKNDFEGQFLSVMETTTLDANGNTVEFNIGFTVEFEQTENQDCLVESKDELNSTLIEPMIRNVIRGYVGKLDNEGIETIDKEDVKAEINNQLSEGNISLNAKSFVDCPLKISMFTITRRN